MNNSEYSIFKPKSSRGIFMDYPDLRKFSAFQGIKNEDMLFVWYFACESSPFVLINSDRERAKLCIDESYIKPGGRKFITEEERESILAGDFRPKIATAITEMKKFRVGPRIRAKMMLEKGFENMEKILDLDAGDETQFQTKEGEQDFGKKKAYVETVAKATDLLPKLVNLLEGNFNLSEGKGKEEEDYDGESAIDRYHENTD